MTWWFSTDANSSCPITTTTADQQVDQSPQLVPHHKVSNPLVQVGITNADNNSNRYYFKTNFDGYIIPL